MVYNKDDNEVYTVEKILRRAGAGLSLSISLYILRKVNTKLKNFFLYNEAFTKKNGNTS